MLLIRMRAAAFAASLALAILAPIAAGAQGAPPAPTAGQQSLYKRLGGYDGIAALTDDFITRLATNTKLSRFFVGASDNSKARIRQLFVDQICNLSGGPCVYLGRDMKTVHKGLRITEDDWNAAVVDLKASFAKFHVGTAEQNDLTAALLKIKPDIVEASR
jgi:hemoglobin